VESLNVGGGIWRIKQQPPQPGGSSSNDGALLIAAMHGGFLVLAKDDGGCRSPGLHTVSVAARYTEHESLAYGADWLGAGLAASCSFYDHVMKIWTV
jgi:diphthamide biosynthesis protein 7